MRDSYVSLSSCSLCACVSVYNNQTCLVGEHVETSRKTVHYGSGYWTQETLLFLWITGTKRMWEKERNPLWSCLMQHVWQDNTSDNGSPTWWSISFVRVHQTKNMTHKSRNNQYWSQLSNPWSWYWWSVYWRNGEESCLILFIVISDNCPENMAVIKSYCMSMMFMYVLPLRYLKTDFSSAVITGALSFLFFAFFNLKREFFQHKRQSHPPESKQSSHSGTFCLKICCVSILVSHSASVLIPFMWQ